MDQVTLSPDFLRSLIYKLRAVMAQEEEVSPMSGSNPSDDERSATLQETPDNLTREEITEQIEDLEPDQQAELVALMWIGRGDMEPGEWAEALDLAVERHEGATADYLLDHPHVADYLDEGIERLTEEGYEAEEDEAG
jgi:hypothetical protein